MKSLVFKCPIKTDIDLMARIAVIAGDIQEIFGILANVHQFYPTIAKRALQLKEDLLSNSLNMYINYISDSKIYSEVHPLILVLIV